MGRTSKTKQLIDDAYEDDYDEEFDVYDDKEYPKKERPIQNQVTIQKREKRKDNLHEQEKIIMKQLSTLTTKQKEITIDSDTKSTSFIIGGHVDAGKSTLLGHLLHSIGNVTTKTMKQYEREASKTGKSSSKYAWILDQNPEERSRGTTIDLSIHSFYINNTLETLIDAPGHKDYMDCLIHGAFMADRAILVVDGAEVLQKNIALGTQEHIRIFSYVLSDRVDGSLLIIINKMDRLEWSRDAFIECESIITSYLDRITPKFNSVTFIPCSAWYGDHLTTKKCDIDWCKEKPTLLEALNIPSTNSSTITVSYSLAMICQISKISDNSATIDVKMLQGVVKTGMTLYLPFSSGKCTVKQISSIQDDHEDITKKKKMNSVYQSEYATFICDHLEDFNTRPGQLLWTCSEPPPGWVCSNTFICRIYAQDSINPSPSILITPGTPSIFYYRNTQIPCVITKLISLYQKKESLPPRFLINGQTAIVHIKTSENIIMYTGSDIQCEMLSRFILSLDGSIIGRGIVTDVG